MSGQDILDQAAGTTPFVHDYLHITWDGTETQNDKATATVSGVAGNPVTGVPTAIGSGAARSRRARSRVRGPDHAERRGSGRRLPTTRPRPDALTFSNATYKVVFLAFPLEAYGTAAQKADLMTRTFAFFGP